MPVTTDSLKGNKPFRCDQCGQETVILLTRVDRRRVCLDCADAKDAAVFRTSDGEQAPDYLSAEE
jgi:formylmethanofuran dehydrogenase subunit E